jgi:hypothetical protein
MNQKVKEKIIFEVYMDFTHTKKVDVDSFIRTDRIRIRFQTSESGSDQNGPDPTGSGSATLLETKTDLEKA